MSLPIFINPFEDPSDIDFFEFDVYVLMLEAFDPEGTEIQFQIVEEFGDGALFYLTPDYNELAFITDPDFEAPSDLDQDNVYEVMVRAEDRDSEEDYRTIYIHVQDVDEGDNNPPEFVSAGFVEVPENPEVAVYIAEAQDPDGDTVTYEITGGADQYLFSIDPETGEVYFNDVLDFENPQDAEGDNFYEIEITASDGYSESDSHSVVIQVTDLDDTAPVLEGDVDFSVEENTAEVPYAVVAYDPEGGDITYDLGGPDGHLFQLGPDGELSFFYAPDFEAPGDADGDNVYEINIVATDEAGNESAMQTVTVTVEDLSDSAPIITSTEDAAEFVENYYDAIYTVEAIDADISDTVTFRFSDESPDAGYFMIDEHSGAIYPMMPFDHEDPQDSNGDNVYELAIIASDGVNDSEDPFVLYVTILNENDNVPVMSEETAEVTVPENIDGTIYTAAASDEDIDGDPLQYILGGADAALFYLDPDSGELSFLAPPDFETALDEGADNIYDVEIIASDGENESDALVLAIEVTDVTEGGVPPVMTSAASASVAENTAGTVYVAQADDPDSANVTFFISGGADAGLFSIDENSGELSFLFSPDYESPTDAGSDNIYEVEITASDGSLDSDALAVAIGVTNVSGMIIGTPDPDDLLGTSEEDVIQGLASNDTLQGGFGADTIDGGSGVDAMIGGVGNDTYSVDNVLDAVTEDLDAGNDTIISKVSIGALADNVENLTLILGALNGSGNQLDNVLTGNSNNNVLSGGAGFDQLNGGFGADTMIGGADNDWYIAHNANDQVIESAGVGEGTADRVFSLVSNTIAANVEILTLMGTTNIDATGSAGNDRLDGNSGNNTLNGLAGNDVMYGLAGDDTLNGGLGVDTMTGGAGSDWYFLDGHSDVVVELAGAAEGTADRMFSWASNTIAANVEILSLMGSANFDATGSSGDERLHGNTGNNTLNGLDGNDVIDGLDGDDVLVGGLGIDNMAGGAGADKFVYTSMADSGITGITRDLIRDFEVGNDRIDLSAIDAIAGGADDAFTFLGTGAFTGTAGQLRYFLVDNAGVGNDFTVIGLDRDGDGIGQSQITLKGLHALSGSDFWL